MLREKVTPASTPIDECQRIVLSISKKADKNKRYARILVLCMTLATASIPVFIVASQDDFVLGKIVPSALAAVSAGLVAFNQLERPHERWVLYRRYHRLFSAEEKKHRFQVEPYDGEDRDSLLGRKITKLEIELQDEWEGLVPSRREIASVSNGG